MADAFEGYQSGLTAPATDWSAITLADVDLPNVPRALECLVDGNVDIVSANGDTVTIKLIAGVPKMVRPVRVKTPSTGTAATGVVGIW